MMAGRGVQLVIVVSRSSVGGQNSEEELKLVDYGSQQVRLVFRSRGLLT